MRDTVDEGHCFVDTALGRLRLAWRGERLTQMRLPGKMRSEGLAPLASPPEWVEALGRRLAAHLDGALDDLLDVPLEEDGLTPARARIYAAARRVLPGQTVSYGELARRIGSPGAARAVGQAMAQNPFPLVVPCHRILSASGPGGFSAPGGRDTKRRLLEIEGVLLPLSPHA